MTNVRARRAMLWAGFAASCLLLAVPVAAHAGMVSASPPSSTFNTQPYFFGGQFNNFQVTNSVTDTTFENASITGPDAGQFSINGDGCSGGTFGDGQTCNVGVNFNQQNGPGTFNAQLEIPSLDGSPDPLIIPLTVQVLAGPAFSASPPRIDFAPTTVGAARAESLTITNTGDFPGGIQQAFVVGPLDFQIEDDQCSQQPINPGQSCRLTVLFRPSAAREFQGSVFAINGTPNVPVLPINLSGEGRLTEAPPDTRITGRPKAKGTSPIASFQFDSPDSGVSFECKVDNGPFTPCTSPSTYVVKRGKHLFQVRSKDANGNLDASPAKRSWKVTKKRGKKK